MKLAHLPLLAMTLIPTTWANAEPDIPAILKKDVLPKLAADLDNENVLIATQDILSLGPLARPLLPDLIRRYNGAKPERKIELLLVLQRVGGDAKLLLPIFEAALKDKAPEMRHLAISGILSLGVDGAPVIPRVLDLLRSEKEPSYTDWSSAPKLGAAAKPLIPFILRDLSKDGFFAGQMFAAALTIDPNDPRLTEALSTILASSATTTGCSAAQSVLAAPKVPRALLDLILAKQNGLDDWCLDSVSTALKDRGLPPLKRRKQARTTPRGISLRLTTSKRTFMIGEPVPVTLEFTVSGERRFFADSKNYDRSGRMHHLGFTVTDASGAFVPDPVRSRGTSMAGGIYGLVEVTTGVPFRQTADLNEWALLNRPGRHSILASPGMIHLDAKDGPYTPIQSPPLDFELIPANEQFISGTISHARSMMKSTEFRQREQAQHLLRFLMSPKALPLMIDGLDDEHGNVQIEASYGLSSYPSTAAVRKALLHAVHDGRPKRASAISEYARHLTQSEVGDTGTQMWDDSVKWRLVLSALQSRNMKRAKLPPRETIEAISAQAMTSADVGACETALDHIESFDEDFIFQNSYVPRLCKAPRLIPHLYRLARGGAAKAGMLRDASYASLIEMGEKQALEEVFMDMGSESPSLQLESYRAAARKDGARASELLMRQVELEASDSRRYGDRHASRLLSNLDLQPDPVRVEAAAEKLFPWKVSELAYTIRKRDPERCARILMGVLEKNPDRPETGAMRGLANLPGKPVEAALSRYLSGKNLPLRAAATEAVGYRALYNDQSLDSNSFAPDLISVFSDRANTPDTRLHAARALQKITGAPIGQIALPDDAHGAQWINGWREWVRKKGL